eukprot:2633364-Pleurochrysis_carterae.AAC.1
MRHRAAAQPHERAAAPHSKREPRASSRAAFKTQTRRACASGGVLNVRESASACVLARVQSCAQEHTHAERLARTCARAYRDALTTSRIQNASAQTAHA